MFFSFEKRVVLTITEIVCKYQTVTPYISNDMVLFSPLYGESEIKISFGSGNKGNYFHAIRIRTR